MGQSFLCLYLQFPVLFPLAVYFDTMVKNQIAILFHLMILFIFSTHNEEIPLTLRHRIVSP